MPDFTPAPCSTATSAPSETNFFTVSGVAATRGSPGSVSAAIAIFMKPPTAARLLRRAVRARAPEAPTSGQKIRHPQEDDCDDDDVPLHQREEHPVGALVLGVIVAFRRCVFRGPVRGHYSTSLSMPGRGQALAESPEAGNAAPALSSLDCACGTNLTGSPG